MIDADRDGQKPAGAARLECVNHPEGQHVVAIAADIGVENQRHRLGGRRAADCCHRHAKHHGQDERSREASLPMECFSREHAVSITPEAL